jgi:hypothetical protein
MLLNDKPMTRRILGLAPALAALVAASCGGKIDSTGGAGRYSELQSSSLSREEVDSSTNAPVSSAYDAGVAIVAQPPATSSTPPAGCPAPEVASGIVPDESSLRLVTFHVTNAGTKVVYIASLGRGCTDYSIEDGNGCPVPLLTWSSDPTCEDQSYGYADTFAILAPGATYETNWFTTYVSAYTQPPSTCVIGASRLVQPGSYRATFGYETSPPAGCSVPGDRPDLLYCATRPNIPGGPVYASRCSTSGKVVTASFAVEAPGQVMTDAGDRIVVPVSLNADP